MLRGLLWIFVSLFFINSYCQKPGFTQFTIDNGLPSNTVYDIAQDENGFIWIATDYGISKFDGISFENYTISDGLPDNEILHFFKDNLNRIWLAGFNGKIGYIKNGEIYDDRKAPFLKELSFENFVFKIFEDSNKNVWFFQSLNKIKKLDSLNNISKKQFNANLPKSHSHNLELSENHNKILQANIFSINQDKSLETFSATINDDSWLNLGYCSFQISDKDSICLSTVINDIIFKQFKYNSQNNFIYNTTQIKKSNFLITNLNEGALLIDAIKPKENSIKILNNIQTTKSFSDLEENIWIGSQSNGVYLFPNIFAKGIQFKSKKRSNLHSVSSFKNKIFVGNDLGEIIAINKETFKSEFILKLDSVDQRVRHLKKHHNSLYVLSDKNVYKFNASLDLSKVAHMYDKLYKATDLKNFKDLSFRDEHVYTANSNGIGDISTTLNTISKLWNIRSSSIAAISQDSIWIGTTKGLYLRTNNTTSKFNLNTKFNNSIIYCIVPSKHGLLIGSNSYGLGILKNGIFKSVSVKNGLLSNYIKSIQVDSNGQIWLSTNFGLNCISIDGNSYLKSAKAYTTSEGLFSNDVRYSEFDTINNCVYVATSKGMNILNLDNNSYSNPPPLIRLNEVVANNKEVKQVNNQKFDYDINNFQFNYSGISIKSLGNISFKYRLKGLEENWIETKSNRVRYSSLPPNNYTFELIAIAKNDLENSNPLQFSFTIRPPFYKTVLFKVACFLILVALTLLILFRIKRKIQKEHKIKEEISVLQYRALNAQMNPHFINNLSVNIIDLANKGEFKQMQNAILQYSKLVNLVLQSTKANLIPLQTEIEMCKIYLEIQKNFFISDFKYNINTNALSSEDLTSIMVPPMILQPIVENSIKHGFKNNTKMHKTISISFSLDKNNFLLCEIIDNGIGYSNEIKNSRGISLKNINQRLQLVNEDSKKEKLVFITDLTKENGNLGGSKVLMKIPLISY